MGSDEPKPGDASPSEDQPTVSKVVESTRFSSDSMLRPGDRIRNYKIMEQIGEGGFAVVYLAEQDRPVRRRVALKIVKLGMDTREVIARFEAERQALAIMDHGHVARVFDAGATMSGRPYFVMEYVAGTPITAHCDRNRLSLEERLELFIQVCDAVQHAHQKAIIHRDIKPSNVLVASQEGESVPKVIDFGVAKAISHRLTEKTIYTGQGQLIGTPLYMSPEQAEMTGENIDTRSDVYSLGVVLYELLTGALPFDADVFKSASLAEIQRILRTEDPPRPSTKLLGLGDRLDASAKARSIDPKSLVREVRGDLDWITLKAIEKERSRRYDSPKALAEDIKRHLTNQAVLASPPSMAYRASKFVRRNTVGVFAAASALVVLIVFAISMAVQARRIAAERDVARRAQAELEQVAEFQARQLRSIDVELMGVRLRNALLAEVQTALERSGLEPDEIVQQTSIFRRQLAGTNFTDMALDALQKNIYANALTTVDEQFSEQTAVKARLLQSLATTMRETGLLETATKPQEEALAIRERLLGDDHPDTLTSKDEMGWLMARQGKLAKADSYLREALDGRRRVLGNEHIDTLVSINHVGLLLYDEGKLEEAEAYCNEALERTSRVLGDEHPETLQSLRNMGRLMYDQGKYDEAEPFYRKVLEGRRRLLGEDHPATLESINNMGFLLFAQGRLNEVEPYYRKALQSSRRVLGDEHPDTLLSINNMGFLLQSQGKLDEAEAYYREALEARRRVLGDEHPDTLLSINNMGFLLQRRGKLAEAEPYYREALDGFRRVLGEEHPTTRVSINNMGFLLNARSRYADAERLLRESLPLHVQVLGADHWRTAEARSLLGEALTGVKQYPRAETYLLQGHIGLEASLPVGRRAEKLSLAANRLVDLYDAWGKPEKAAKWRSESESALR